MTIAGSDDDIIYKITILSRLRSRAKMLTHPYRISLHHCETNLLKSTTIVNPELISSVSWVKIFQSGHVFSLSLYIYIYIPCADMSGFAVCRLKRVPSIAHIWVFNAWICRKICVLTISFENKMSGSRLHRSSRNRGRNIYF